MSCTIPTYLTNVLGGLWPTDGMLCTSSSLSCSSNHWRIPHPDMSLSWWGNASAFSWIHLSTKRRGFWITSIFIWNLARKHGCHFALWRSDFGRSLCFFLFGGLLLFCKTPKKSGPWFNICSFQSDELMSSIVFNCLLSFLSFPFLSFLPFFSLPNDYKQLRDAPSRLTHNECFVIDTMNIDSLV